MFIPSATPGHWISFDDSLETSRVNWLVNESKWQVILPPIDKVDVMFLDSISEPIVRIDTVQFSMIPLALLIGGLMLLGGDKNGGKA